MGYLLGELMHVILHSGSGNDLPIVREIIF